jgi:hypothetical protein
LLPFVSLYLYLYWLCNWPLGHWVSTLITLLLLLLFHCLLWQAFCFWYLSSWPNDDPHRSGFKFQTAVLSVLCIMFESQLSFVVNLLNVFLVWLPNFFLNLLLLCRSLQLLPV